MSQREVGNVNLFLFPTSRPVNGKERGLSNVCRITSRGLGQQQTKMGMGMRQWRIILGERVQLRWTCWMAKVEQTVAGCIYYFCNV
jgi:hypothetical protein